jgi:hypothetical protein
MTHTQCSAGSAALVDSWRKEAKRHFSASNGDDCAAGAEEWMLHREAVRIYKRCADELEIAILAQPQALSMRLAGGLLLGAHSALDDALGDSDVTHVEDDDELRDRHPVQWAAQRVAQAIELLEEASSQVTRPQ